MRGERLAVGQNADYTAVTKRGQPWALSRGGRGRILAERACPGLSCPLAPRAPAPSTPSTSTTTGLHRASNRPACARPAPHRCRESARARDGDGEDRGLLLRRRRLPLSRHASPSYTGNPPIPACAARWLTVVLLFRAPVSSSAAPSIASRAPPACALACLQPVLRCFSGTTMPCRPPLRPG